MRIDVTFTQTDMEVCPAFDTIIPMDISSASVQALVDGSISGEYVSDKVTRLRMGVFSQCENLTRVSLPNCTEMNWGVRSFYKCTNITILELPKLETITEGNYTFTNMDSIREISLPSLTKITTASSTFSNCKAVRKIILPRLSGTTIGSGCFDNAYYLNTLVLGGDTLNPLGNTNAFRNAGSWSTLELNIYVPDNLVETYKTATNWTAYADKIKPISEWEG